MALCTPFAHGLFFVSCRNFDLAYKSVNLFKSHFHKLTEYHIHCFHGLAESKTTPPKHKKKRILDVDSESLSQSSKKSKKFKKKEKSSEDESGEGSEDEVSSNEQSS